MSLTIVRPPGTRQEDSNTARLVVDDIGAGRDTRAFPHQLKDTELAVADNVVFYRDHIASKRPGNKKYGGAGVIGTGVASLAGVRFYSGNPTVGKTIVQSGGKLYSMNDVTGIATQLTGGTGFSTTQPCSFAQTFDPDAAGGGATSLIICDGARIPQEYNGASVAGVQTGGTFLPNGRTGNPITPKYVARWGLFLVYAGDPTEPCGLYISDGLRPQRFTGFSYQDSQGSSYIPYFPGQRDGEFGDITAVAIVNGILVVFHTAGIVSCRNTGVYGATEFIFDTISSQTGMPSPRSLARFDGLLAFYGGDSFYATDGQSYFPLKNVIPDVYEGAIGSSRPPDIKNETTVVGMRRQQLYIASYDNDASGQQKVCAMFDLAANGGWAPGGPAQEQGGAWARWFGMHVGWGFESRGTGDKYQFFWGASDADQLYQFDAGTFDDDGVAITMEVRTKSFYVGDMVTMKTLIDLWLITAFDTLQTQISETFNPYVIMDATKQQLPAVAAVAGQTIPTWGSGTWGGLQWVAADQKFIGLTVEDQAQFLLQGTAIAFGVVETSKNAFSLFGFEAEVTIDEPT